MVEGLKMVWFRVENMKVVWFTVEIKDFVVMGWMLLAIAIWNKRDDGVTGLQSIKLAPILTSVWIRTWVWPNSKWIIW